MNKWLAVFLFAVIGLMGGCATSVDRGYMLERTLIVYEKTIRWGNFEAALGFRKPGSAATSLPRERGDRIKVGGYDVVNQNMSEDGMRMSQSVEISYYHSDSARLLKVVDRQEWEYDRERGQWYIASDLPRFE